MWLIPIICDKKAFVNDFRKMYVEKSLCWLRYLQEKIGFNFKLLHHILLMGFFAGFTRNWMDMVLKLIYLYGSGLWICATNLWFHYKAKVAEWTAIQKMRGMRFGVVWMPALRDEVPQVKAWPAVWRISEEAMYFWQEISGWTKVERRIFRPENAFWIMVERLGIDPRTIVNISEKTVLIFEKSIRNNVSHGRWRLVRRK